MFQTAGSLGSAFGLRMTNHAAYSLNFLHHGAPKYWTVVKPANHVKLELKLHPVVEQAGGRDRRLQFIDGKIVKDCAQAKTLAYQQLGGLPCDFPPRCDPFLTHQPFYIPSTSLDVWEIGYTRVAQYEGEMIIIFPFAYHEGYACGPSLAEVAEHKNDRSELFCKAGLYRDCHYQCTGPALPLDFARRTSDVSFATAPETCQESYEFKAENDISIRNYANRENVDEIAGTSKRRPEAAKKASTREDIIREQPRKVLPKPDVPERRKIGEASPDCLPSQTGKTARLPARGYFSKARYTCMHDVRKYDPGIPPISKIDKGKSGLKSKQPGSKKRKKKKVKKEVSVKDS